MHVAASFARRNRNFNGSAYSSHVRQRFTNYVLEVETYTLPGWGMDAWEEEYRHTMQSSREGTKARIRGFREAHDFELSRDDILQITRKHLGTSTGGS